MNWYALSQLLFALFSLFALGSIYGKVRAIYLTVDPGEKNRLRRENEALRTILALQDEDREKNYRLQKGLFESVAEYRKLLGLKPGERRPAAPETEKGENQ